MTGRYWIAGATLAAIFLGPITAWGQTPWPCTRLEGGGCSAVAGADVCEGTDDEEGEPDWAEDYPYGETDSTDAECEAAAILTNSIASGLATASCPTAENGSTSAPQVTCTAGTEVLASVPNGYDWAYAYAGTGAYAYATFEVDDSSTPSGDLVLIGRMHLVATGGGGVYSWSASLGADCGGSEVDASALDGTVTISGTLKEIDETDDVFQEVTLGGINLVYGVSEYTEVEDTHIVSSGCDFHAYAEAPGTSGTIWSGSSSSSFYVVDQ